MTALRAAILLTTYISIMTIYLYIICYFSRYGIPRDNLTKRIRLISENKSLRRPGRHTVFSIEEERVFVVHIIALASYEFPVTPFELRVLIKSYLNKIDRLNKEVIDLFFDHLAAEVKDIPAGNIWNYDETNFRDDPGSKKNHS